MPYVLLSNEASLEQLKAILESGNKGAESQLAQPIPIVNGKKKRAREEDEDVDEEDLSEDEEVDSADEEAKKEAAKNYAPAGTISEVKNLYQGDPDKHGQTTWTSKYPDDLEDPPENDESAQYALLIRNRKAYDGRRKLQIDSLVIQSKQLKEVLGEVLQGYPGVSTTHLMRLEFSPPFQPFVHRWEQFEKAREDEKDEVTRKHLDLLHAVLSEELGDEIAEKNDLLKNGVARYDNIWTLFEPGCQVFSRSNEGDHERVYKFTNGDFRHSQCLGPHYALDVQYIDWDGDSFGYGSTTIEIRAFSGTKPITKLPVFPLNFHPKKAELTERLITRGKTFEDYQGYHFKSYDGIALGWGPWGMVRYQINSRIIIDTYAFNRFNPGRKVRVSRVAKHRPADSDSDSDDYESDYDDDYGQSACSNKRAKLDGVAPLTDDQRLIATHELRGYSLKDKKWLLFSIPSVGEISWNSDAFGSLVAPPEQKELILAFARTQMANKAGFDDVIQGKGQGLILLLSGPPGVGKTLTAESVAEAMRVPLYTMSAGDLGTQPHEVENKLNNILEMNTKWNAVLLLDEADVFLEARDPHDLERNKLVSIFLRLLEYYEGILFLTTNRVDNIDAAFESRIHLSLQYHDLDESSRRHVWSTFLKRASNAEGFDDEQLASLASRVMNGRQIKNVIKAAQLLATERGTPLRFTDVDTVLRIRDANTGPRGSTLGA